MTMTWGQTIPFEQFYRKMAEGASTSTSQINPEEYAAYFEPFLKAGKDVLHLCLSSGITSTMNSACIARDMLAEQYPDRKIFIVDSLAASSGCGLLMDRLADLRDQGLLWKRQVLRGGSLGSKLTLAIRN